MVILLSKYDISLEEHVKTSVFKSQLAETRQDGSPGCPVWLVTHLSKTTADYIIVAKGYLLKKDNVI